jgi:uncharacterized protein YdaU (DUF1376 family)
MSKDPAFLFYSKDFYEATRTMLPKERACYIDLLIYQHQHEIIPNDIKRIVMYCSGIDEATLKAVLQAKFKLCDKGWYNERLNKVVQERKDFSLKQSGNGLVGQFFKKAKATLKVKEYNKLKDFIYNDYSKDKLLEDLKKEGSHEAMLEAMLKHLEDVNVDVIKDSIKGSDEEIETDLPTEPLHPLQLYVKEKFPSVSKMEVQLTHDNCIKLLEKYSNKQISDTLIAMENYKPLLSKSKNVYLTLLTWLKKDDKPKQEVTPPYANKLNRYNQ